MKGLAVPSVGKIVSTGIAIAIVFFLYNKFLDKDGKRPIQNLGRP